MDGHYLDKTSYYFAADKRLSVVEGLKQKVESGLIRDRRKGCEKAI